MLRYLTGQRYRSVSARFATLHKRNAQEQPIKVEDNAICILEMENGIMGSMTASWTYYGAEDNSTVLYGTEGILKIYDDPNFAMVAVLKGGERICFDLEGIQTNVSQTRSGVIDEFIAVILEGKESELSGRRPSMPCGRSLPLPSLPGRIRPFLLKTEYKIRSWRHLPQKAASSFCTFMQNQLSLWIKSPLRSFGSNQVDFGGIT